MADHLSTRVRAALALLVSAACALTLLPSNASAHGVGVPWIYVEADQVWPGEPFHVLVLDVAPFVTVSLRAELGDASVTLGEVATGAQGHGELDVTLPADFPFGHALLRGLGDDGSEVSTMLRVGDAPPIDTPVGPPVPPSQPASSLLADPSVLTLGVIVGGGLLALGWLALRRRRGHVEEQATDRPAASVALPPQPLRAARRRRHRSRGAYPHAPQQPHRRVEKTPYIGVKAAIG